MQIQINLKKFRTLVLNMQKGLLLVELEYQCGELFLSVICQLSTRLSLEQFGNIMLVFISITR